MAVSVGLPGDLVGGAEGSVVDAYLCKVGGQPVLPKEVAKTIDKDVVTCPKCGVTLALVAQVSEAETKRGDDFLVCVFVCSEAACPDAWRHWTALRLRAEGSGVEEEEEEEEVEVVDSGKTEADPFGGDQSAEGDEDWWNDTSWNDTGDDVEVDDGLDIVAAFQKTSLGGTVKPKPKPKPKKKDGARAGDGGAVNCEEVCPSPNSFPAFRLHFAPEPRKQSRESKLDLRVKELVEEFENSEEGKARGRSQNQAEGSNGGASRGGKPSGEPEATWTNEEYESEPVDEKQFHKFLSQIDLEPSQCVRWYNEESASTDKHLLWPTKTNQPICSGGEEGGVPRCELCGGKRACKLQIMGGILSYIQEAMEWTGTQDSPSARGLEKANFVTVAVFCCERGCKEVLKEGGCSENLVAKEWCVAKHEE
ncbi:programmed cell death protein 2 domain-containing protein [Chloropicon primus]|uniref:Programmed cell death protein 2 C-terminal domain-containing protein n=1 Tax=Chloropicon primus TaxID=1764295 RepID=A0A5B8MDI8_9CHLO|nr:hypothetical protein A3770_01p10010 [Chloropicon primus]UPQ97692.1 programmed cell death protein 2 domain-containing protein [Chloropicon primus]|eukprot:QDZ18483.1 hypothetical protein A3770_01p10010 [Chloropicon primus]